MRKCPFCAESIKKEAIKCKHCGEWLNIKKEKESNQIVEPYTALKFEKINKILRQGNVFIDLSNLPDISAGIPEEYLTSPKNSKVPDIMAAKTYGYKGIRNIRYSGLQFKGWGMYDLIITDSRMVLIGATPRARGISTAMFGLTGIAIMTAFEKYQQFTKDKKIELNNIDKLVESGAAVSLIIENIDKIVVAQEKLSLAEKCMIGIYDAQSRVIISGNFLYKSNNMKGFIGFQSGSNKKSTRKLIEKNIDYRVTMMNNKVDVNSDYRDSLANS